MRVTLYSQPGSASKPNEDFAVATPSSVVVLDGLTAPADLGTGCVHGTPWFVAQLAGSLSRILSIATGGSLQGGNGCGPLLRAGKARFSDKTVFRQVSEFTYELDLDEGMGHTIRVALLNGALQDGGQEAGIGQYRLTVLDDKSRVPLHEYAAGPAPAAGQWPAGPLTSHTGEQLVSELVQRLKTRGPRSS